MPGPTALVTLADVYPYLNMASGTNDAELQGFIDAAQPVIEDIIGPVVNATFDEWYDGGGPVIALRHRPIVSITSVTEYIGTAAYALTAAVTPDVATAYSYSLVTTGRLLRRSPGGVRPFAGGAGDVHVVYIAGRATVPANVRLATLELIRHNYQLTQQGGRPAFGGAAGEEGPWIPSGFAVPTRVIEMLTPNRRHPSIA